MSLEQAGECIKHVSVAQQVMMKDESGYKRTNLLFILVFSSS